MLNFIPVLSAGRSGTKKLSELFSGVLDTYAEHEGEPGFHTKRLESSSERLQFVHDKINYYQSLGRKNIVHTGHMMGLGFLEMIVDQMPTKDCIVLYRPWREIATSMFLLDWIPYKQKFITPWYSGPNEDGVLHYDGYEKAHPYQLCYWWCLESDRRIKEQSKWLSDRGITLHHCDIKSLLQLDKMNDLLVKLDMNTLSVIDVTLSNDYQSLRNHTNLNRTMPPISYLEQLESEVHERTSYMGY